MIDPLPMHSANPELVFPAFTDTADGAAQVLALERQLDQTQWWPAERIRQQQARQLARLVAHARAHVPFYAGRLEDADHDILDARWWRALPPLTRTEVRRNADQLASRGPAHGGVRRIFTSGSTGVPLEVRQSDAWFIMLLALKLRFYRWYGYDFRGTMVEIRALREASGVRERVHPAWEWPYGALYRTGPWIELDVFAPVDEQIAALERHAPHYLLTMANNLRALARGFRRAGTRLPTLQWIRTFGERLDPDLRAECREIFGAGVIDLYGAVECGYAAIQCPRHEHYHVQSEFNVVEILDDAGRPCRPGEIGRIVVTPLQNFAMPLLRYETGDLAEPGEPCACGRGLPVLRRIVGRENDALVLPSGERRFATFASRVLGPISAVEQFQIVQKTTDLVIVRLVLERALTDAEQQQIRSGVSRQVGPDFAVELEVVPGIPPTPGGKRREFVSEVAARAR